MIRAFFYAFNNGLCVNVFSAVVHRRRWRECHKLTHTV